MTAAAADFLAVLLVSTFLVATLFTARLRRDLFVPGTFFCYSVSPHHVCRPFQSRVVSPRKWRYRFCGRKPKHERRRRRRRLHPRSCSWRKKPLPLMSSSLIKACAFFSAAAPERKYSCHVRTSATRDSSEACVGTKSRIQVASVIGQSKRAKRFCSCTQRSI